MKIGILKGAALLPLMLAALSLSACGGSTSGGQTGGTPTPTPTPTSVPLPTPTPTPPPVTDISYQTLAAGPTTSGSYPLGGFAGFQYNGNPETGQIVPNSPISGGGGGHPPIFRYDHPTRTYTLISWDVVAQRERYLLFTMNADETSPADSDNLFVGYRKPNDSQIGASILRLYRPGSTNPQLALTYSGIGHLRGFGPVFHLNFSDSWFGYGVETRTNDIPSGGTARYNGILHGFAIQTTAGQQYKIEGTSSVVLNFGTRRATATVNMTLIANDGTRITVGPASMEETPFGHIDGSTYPFNHELRGANVPYGSLYGRPYGPSVAEVAGVFNITITVPGVVGDINAHGAYAAVRN